MIDTNFVHDREKNVKIKGEGLRWERGGALEMLGG